MATNAPITDSTQAAPEFRVNGCLVSMDDEPYSYIDQAHAILAMITTQAGELGGLDQLAPNWSILLNCLNAAETLLGYGAFHLSEMDRRHCEAMRDAHRPVAKH